MDRLCWQPLSSRPSLEPVAVLQVLLMIAGVVVLISLPCLVLVAITVGDSLHRARRAVFRGVRRRFRRDGLSWRQHRRLARLDRTLESPTRREPTGPPIEQLAADLRRLGRQRVGIATRSPIWFTAVQRAYDERLRLACRELCIEEHLDRLEGMDLEIERVRAEGELESAGIVLYRCQQTPSS
jgi:hypothetical protein